VSSTRTASRTRRIVPLVIVAVIVALVIAFAIVVVPKLASGLSLGQSLEELNGQTKTTHFASASGASGETPAWVPAAATNLTIEVPGPNSKSPGGVQLDADVPSGFALPATCTPTGQSFPWAHGWSGLDIRTASLEKCGSWTATVVNGHLYAWQFAGPNS
jgi:hypothetical protein